jgi:alpha-beta hydrolase superfamily lysophospholipase
VVETALFIGCRGTELPAILTRPAGPCRAAVILLHPADVPSRRQFLFEHLARVLPELGIAVLRYDRRARAGDGDVPYPLQVDDLNRARDVVAREVATVPTGMWAFSRGAWVALLAVAADPAVAFLMLVGCSAVSPARQMLYGTAEQLRRAGFGSQAIAELGKLLRAVVGAPLGSAATCRRWVSRWVMSHTTCVLLVSGDLVRPADQHAERGSVSRPALSLPSSARSR